LTITGRLTLVRTVFDHMQSAIDNLQLGWTPRRLAGYFCGATPLALRGMS